MDALPLRFVKKFCKFLINLLTATQLIEVTALILTLVFTARMQRQNQVS